MAPSLCDYLALSSKRLMLTNGALLGERLSFCKFDHSFHKSPSKSSAVRPETVSSISFSQKAASYLSRPRLRSQSPRASDDCPGETTCPGQ